ncbi:hypothetical protein H0H10_20880 [Streptomyces sp. TRM S81-3]|uniref:Lipoyl-binding domain-containing protein n=1 Tax=Streptomyces griseicoloratus TaxID=2752516 RepID=A0A926L4Q5_9ACTN|nr:biotin/lipoyl-containing protein [Streptomyces griseicoloratus]MBD0421576.1 hypothetical protein [Streptomyces griseicoloratus]
MIQPYTPHGQGSKTPYKEGDRFHADESIGIVEAVKTQTTVEAPVGGEVVDVNKALIDRPEPVNDAPYDDGWLIVLRTDGPTSTDGLLTADQYAEYIKDETD